MTFTELEYVLMMFCLVLLWRNAILTLGATAEKDRANQYARWLIAIHEGKGAVITDGKKFQFKQIKE